VFEAEVDRRCPGARALLGPAARDAVRRDFLAALVELCLAYLLNCTDLHRENLICSGEHPVLIDLKTLLLPRWELSAAGTPVDVSGLDRGAGVPGRCGRPGGGGPLYCYGNEAQRA
jgi:hypothetical protein